MALQFKYKRPHCSTEFIADLDSISNSTNPARALGRLLEMMYTNKTIGEEDLAYILDLDKIEIDK